MRIELDLSAKQLQGLRAFAKDWAHWHLDGREMSDADAASMPAGILARSSAPEVVKPLLLVAPPSVAPVTPPAAPAGAVRPTHSFGSKRVKDTKP